MNRFPSNKLAGKRHFQVEAYRYCKSYLSSYHIMNGSKLCMSCKMIKYNHMQLDICSSNQYFIHCFVVVV